MCASGPPRDDGSRQYRRSGTRPVASGKSPNRLVGRDPELDRIGALLDQARVGVSGALVIEGEAGIGKTTLLEAAQDLASGFRCMWARGVESEAVLGHAALLGLATPLRDRMSAVPAAQGAALATALGWAEAHAPADRFLVGAATLSLLAALAEDGPVLVLVDDVQWVDGESASALLFAARRLSRDAVAFLFTVRTGTTPRVPLHGLPLLTLAGLPTRVAAQMMPPGVSEQVLRRLVAGTDGNPLALLEVSGRLTPAQRVGAAALPQPLPVGDRLQQVYGNVLTALSAHAWHAVLLCAVSTQDHPAVLRALARDGVDAGGALDEAEERGVLLGGDGMRFRHPLLRSAVLRLATPAQRRAAHRSLAAALPDGAARTWHLAEAEGGTNDVLADELAAVAEQYRTRQGFAAAAAALARAALLTADADRAAERLAAAAHHAFLAGDVERTRALADRVLAGRAGPKPRGEVLLTLGMLEQYGGSIPRAAELLAAAAEEAEVPQRIWALEELAHCRFRLGDLAGVLDCADRIDAVADKADLTQRLLAAFTRGAGLTVTGDPAAGRPFLAEVLSYAREPTLHEDPRLVVCLALAAGFTGDLRDAHQLGGPLLTSARARGAVGLLVPILALNAMASSILGNHDRAFADAGESAELGEQLGYAADTAIAVEMLAWQSAARGLHEDARRALARARELTDRAGTTSVAAHQAITGAFCALSRGDLGDVVKLLEARIAADGGVGMLGEPLGVAPMLVEAYVGLNRRADAAALTQHYAERTPQPAIPATKALIARCQALAAADDNSAVAAFEAALAAHADDPNVTEAARTRLLYGARLRRSGQRVAAREQLRTANTAFAAMGLTAWAHRAADELAATGVTARPRRPLDTEPLTSQETRVALLAAEGLSNREIAGTLFLSPKTIEHHLASVFRKRGFRSRTELARAFASETPPL